MDDVSISFVELVALTRIAPDSTVEKFGSLINSSFFDASNILATLKQKGLVDFVTAFPSQSTLKVTEKGSALLAEATKRSTEPIDQLDTAILSQLGNGRRGLVELSGALNVAQTDLAIHIYKLSVQQSLTYELVNATVSMYLTEKGFLAAKNSPQPVQQAGPAAVAPVTNGAEPQSPAPSKNVEDEIKVLEALSKRRKMGRKIMIICGLAAVLIILVVFVYFSVNPVA